MLRRPAPRPTPNSSPVPRGGGPPVVVGPSPGRRGPGGNGAPPRGPPRGPGGGAPAASPKPGRGPSVVGYGPNSPPGGSGARPSWASHYLSARGACRPGLKGAPVQPSGPREVGVSVGPWGRGLNQFGAGPIAAWGASYRVLLRGPSPPTPGGIWVQGPWKSGEIWGPRSPPPPENMMANPPSSPVYPPIIGGRAAGAWGIFPLALKV